MSQYSDRVRPASPVRPLTPRGEKTRQLLLEAAEAVFGEKGYERASIAEITQRAGVAQGTFYVYFPDKRVIFTELVRDLNDRLRDHVLAALDGLTDRMEIEHARFESFFTFICAHRNLYRIVRQAEFVDEDLYRWYYRRIADGYAAGLAGSMEQGQIRQADPEILAYCLMGIADFVGMRWGLWEGQRPKDALFRDLMTFIRSGLAGAP
jgi:AcrR family transcriptional regulator